MISAITHFSCALIAVALTAAVTRFITLRRLRERDARARRRFDSIL